MGPLPRRQTLPESKAAVLVSAPASSEAGWVTLLYGMFTLPQGRGHWMEGWVAPFLPFGITRTARKNSCVIVQNGKKGTPMGAFKSILTVEEILRIYQ